VLYTSNVVWVLPQFSYAFQRKNITRNSSGDEIANVNFLYDDIIHVLQNTIDSCINSATDRRGGYVLERMFTKFSEITQCNGHCAVQGHSRSPILVPIESSYTTSYYWLIVTYLLHRFQVMVQSSLARGECLTLTLSLGVIPYKYSRKWYITKNLILGLHFCRRKYQCISNHFT